MEYSFITPDLFIGNMPASTDYDHLREMGVRLVINMRFVYGPRADAHSAPMSVLWLKTIDSPFFPIPMSALQRGAAAALETIRNGGKVYAHCAHGRHRGVTMGAAILIAQGYAADAAMKLIKEKRPKADPFAFYIRPRILKFAKTWDVELNKKETAR